MVFRAFFEKLKQGLAKTRGAKQVLNNALLLGVEKVPFGVEIQEVKPGAVIGERTGYSIAP